MDYKDFNENKKEKRALTTPIIFIGVGTTLSLPQFVMLKKVMEKKLIAAYAGIISIGILILGYVFNPVLG